jgi:hypothetical protein
MDPYDGSVLSKRFDPNTIESIRNSMGCQMCERLSERLQRRIGCPGQGVRVLGACMTATVCLLRSGFLQST